jgi:hypothetical protein
MDPIEYKQPEPWILTTNKYGKQVANRNVLPYQPEKIGGRVPNSALQSMQESKSELKAKPVASKVRRVLKRLMAQRKQQITEGISAS